MLTVPQAAERAGRNPETIRRWIRSGRLPAEKVGTQHVIDERELNSLLDEQYEMLPLPPHLQKTWTGEPQPNWVRIIRLSRESH